MRVERDIQRRVVSVRFAEVLTGTLEAPGRHARARLDASLAAGRAVVADISPTVWVGALVAFVAALTAYIFFRNGSAPYLPYHDSWEYIQRADIILAGGPWADAIRMPGYPIVLAAVFALTGVNNLAAAQALQYALFVITAVGVYALAWRVFRHLRLAALVGLLFGTNLYLLSFFRPILSDGLGAALIMALALAITYFIERPTPARFWIIAALSLLALMTRGEWSMAPLILFPYLLFVAQRKGMTRRLLAPMGLALLLTYGIVGGYMAMNAHFNGYFGLTDSTNINLYGKITQYNMQGEAPASYPAMTGATEAFVGQNILDPWHIYNMKPTLAGHSFKNMGAFAQAIIMRHPLEFLWRTVPVGFRSLYNYYLFGGYNPNGHLARVIKGVQAFSVGIYPLFMLFPLCGLFWLAVVALSRSKRITRQRFHGWNMEQPEVMGALSLLAFYALAITSLTSYDEYGRLHLAFDALMLVVVVYSVAAFFGILRPRTTAK